MPLSEHLARFKPLQIDTASGVMQYRSAASMEASKLPVTHVLLHGIGSGSASWVHQFIQTTKISDASTRVLAWDAPGYGASSALPTSAPLATDYARRMWDWLDAVRNADNSKEEPNQPITLVGHALGCLIAASATRSAPQRVKKLILLSPAQGYARASTDIRAKKLNDRLEALARLGVVQMAQSRAAAMLSVSASADQIEFVQTIMSQINPMGYAQAARMLSAGDLLTDLEDVTCPMMVASGNADNITPPADCIAAAAHVGSPYTSLIGAGHACAIEAPDAICKLLGLNEIHEVNA